MEKYSNSAYKTPSRNGLLHRSVNRDLLAGLIHWMRANGKWQAYEPDPLAFTVDEALRIVEADQYGCFFG